MGVKAINGGSGNDATSDALAADTTSGDGALKNLWAASDVGAGYGVTSYMTPPQTTQVASDLSALQSGSTGTAPIDLNTAFASTLGSVVAGMSGSAPPNTTGVGYYKAPNGQTYAIGTGPGPGATTGTSNTAGTTSASSVPGGVAFWICAAAVLYLFVKEERHG